MRTLVNRPSSPENLAHGLQSSTELPCEVSNWFHCLWPTGGWASWNILTARAKLHRNVVAQAVFWMQLYCSGWIHLLCPLHLATLSWVTRTSECYVLVGVFWLHLKLFSTGLIQHNRSMLLKSSKEVFCFPWLSHFAYTWCASPHKRFVSIAVWKCPLEVD